jgi:hypothetical protein
MVFEDDSHESVLVSVAPDSLALSHFGLLIVSPSTLTKRRKNNGVIIFFSKRSGIDFARRIAIEICI